LLGEGEAVLPRQQRKEGRKEGRKEAIIWATHRRKPTGKGVAVQGFLLPHISFLHAPSVPGGEELQRIRP
jgi:hypothetical protein